MRSLDKKGRRLFEKTYGSIPIGYDVHHKDGNHDNNSLDNLILIKSKYHLAWHGVDAYCKALHKNWQRRPLYARPKTLDFGLYLARFDNDGRSSIILKPQEPRRFKIKWKSPKYKVRKAETKFNYGLSSFKHNALDEAYKYFEETIGLAPELLDAWYYKGLILYKQGENSEALECFKKVTKTRSKFAFAWNIMGNALHKLSFDNEALLCYDKTLELRPTLVEAWYDKGDLFLDSNNLSEALSCYERGMGIDAGYADSWYFKGVSLMKQGFKEDAFKCLMKGEEIQRQELAF